MYQPYSAKSGNKQIRFYSLPYNTVFLRIVWDFAPISQRNMTLKYFRLGLNLKPLNVPNPKLDNFFYSFSKLIIVKRSVVNSFLFMLFH